VRLWLEESLRALRLVPRSNSSHSKRPAMAMTARTRNPWPWPAS